MKAFLDRVDRLAPFGEQPAASRFVSHQHLENACGSVVQGNHPCRAIFAVGDKDRARWNQVKFIGAHPLRAVHEIHMIFLHQKNLLRWPQAGVKDDLTQGRKHRAEFVEKSLLLLVVVLIQPPLP